ncbi:50S ribosomal protein L32e [Candidatus Bathyarchaeota archaeon]|nr:50S ribosomal protein L32e [Candidatus Bathyarchaeota archaeon]
MTEKKASPSRKALQARARARNKKPKFLRAESWRFDRFSTSWRRPRGLDNKIRRKILGWPAGPSMGYKGPKVARYLHPSGYKEVIVFNVADLSNVDVNTQAVRIAHRVGKRKRADIIAKATEMNLKILNLTVSAEAEEEETEEEETEEEAAEGKETKAKEKKPAKEEKTPVKKKEASKKKETKPKKKENKKQ